MRRSELDTDLEELERQIENELLSLQTYEDEKLLTSQALTPQMTANMMTMPGAGYQLQNHSIATNKQLETNQQSWQHGFNQQSQQVNSSQNQKHQRPKETYPKSGKESQQSAVQQSQHLAQQQQLLRDSSFNKLKDKNKNLFTIEDLSSEELKQTKWKTPNTLGKKKTTNSIPSGIVSSSRSPNKGIALGKENHPPVPARKANANNRETKERIDSQGNQSEERRVKEKEYQNHNNQVIYPVSSPQQMMQHPYQQLLLPFSFNGNNNAITERTGRINNIDSKDNAIAADGYCNDTSANTTGFQMASSQSNSQLVQSRYLLKNKSNQTRDSLSNENNQYSFKPMLSKKSMQMAEKMEDARVRLVNSKEKYIEKVERLREELDNRYSFKPTINSNYNADRRETRRRDDEGEDGCDDDEENDVHQESVFNYSDDEDDNDENNQLNRHNQQNNHNRPGNNKNNNGRSSSSSAAVTPRWECLYERHKAQQIAREMRIIDKERAQNEDPELTFQPVLFKQNYHNYMYADSEFDVAKRSEMWQLKKLDKLKRIKEEFNKKHLEPCTFHPNRTNGQSKDSTNDANSRTSRSSNRGDSSNMGSRSSVQGNRTQAVTNNTNNNNNSNEYFSSQLSEFSKQGMIDYFERVDLAKRLRQEAEQQQNKPLGVNWQNKVTVPREFSFMKKDTLEWLDSVNSQASTGSRSSGVVIGAPLPKAPRIMHSNSQSTLEHSKMRSISQKNIQRIDGNEEKASSSNGNSNHESLSGNQQDKVLNKLKDSLHKHLHSMQM